MGAVTEIGWADSTTNFWIGCTKVSDACKDCYAVPIAANLGVGWGDDAPRHRTSEELWRAPLRWNAMHDRGQIHMIHEGKSVPVPLRIFSNSLSDFFDNHPDVAPWREEAWTHHPPDDAVALAAPNEAHPERVEDVTGGLGWRAQLPACQHRRQRLQSSRV